jgi:hypothetical protein
MCDVQRKGPKTPLLRCLDVVCVTKAYTTASLGPVEVGAVGYVEGGGGSEAVEEGGGGQMMVELALEASGRHV